MNMPLLPLLLVAASLLGSGCAGYRLGNIPATSMTGVKTIYVPVIKNDTYEPGLPVMVTNAVLRRLETDGTYRSARLGEADATLEIKIVDFNRSSLRKARADVAVAEEYRATLSALATLTNNLTGKKIFSERRFSGSTEFFIQQNTQEGERQALPLAADQLAYQIVSAVSEGW